MSRTLWVRPAGGRGSQRGRRDFQDTSQECAGLSWRGFGAAGLQTQEDRRRWWPAPGGWGHSAQSGGLWSCSLEVVALAAEVGLLGGRRGHWREPAAGTWRKEGTLCRSAVGRKGAAVPAGGWLLFTAGGKEWMPHMQMYTKQAVLYFSE